MIFKIKKQHFFQRSLILLVILGLSTITFPDVLEAQTLVWGVISNPSSERDEAHAIIADDTYIYIAGYDETSSNNYQMRIEKRRKSDGGLVWQQTNNPTSGPDIARAITADDTYIYIAGQNSWEQWRIEKRRKSNGGLVWQQTVNFSAGIDIAYAITSDDTYIYVAGDGYSTGNGSSWRIEKRRKSNGGLVWTKTSYSSSSPKARAITADAVYIYVGGYSPGDKQWHIEKRRKSDGGLEWEQASDPSSGSDRVYGIAEDESYIYAVGIDRWHIEKRRKSDGGLEWEKTGSGYVFSVTVDDDYIYTAGQNSEGQWRIEKRRKSNGEVEWGETINLSSGADRVQSATLSDEYLYIAGWGNYDADTQWYIQKWTKGASYVDIGLRVYDEDLAEPIKIAAEPAGTLTSPLRIVKNGVIYGIVLVDPGDPNDSGVRIQTSSGIKALRKF